MKLEINIIKSLLADIENSADYPEPFIINKVDGVEADSVTINYHLVLMIEAGLISGLEKINHDKRYVLVERMTWAGHDFLANAKNPDIWKRFEEASSSFGSFSINILQSALTNIAYSQINQMTAAIA
ncbi:hypothetical protein FACS1894170_07000 [Planctomycetales bacterium]|nr:hypothetical protein FACS1894170_07000 [Planctomycetales bacterium]